MLLALGGFEKRPGIALKQRQHARQPLVGPFPPGQRLKACRGFGILEAWAQRASGVADDDGVGVNVLGHHAAGTDDGAIADGDAGQHDGTVADPDIVTDHDTILGAPVEDPIVDALVAAGEAELAGAVAEMVQRRTPPGVIAGVDAHAGGDRREPADLGEHQVAIALDIAVVAERDVVEDAAVAHLGPGAQATLVESRRGRAGGGGAQASGSGL